MSSFQSSGLKYLPTKDVVTADIRKLVVLSLDMLLTIL